MKHDPNLIRQLEDELKIRVVRGPSDKESHGPSLNAKLRGLGAFGHSRGRGAFRGSGGTSGGEGSGGQRVVIKASYTVHNRVSSGRVLSRHVRYLSRDSASLDGLPGRFHNDRERSVDAAEVVRQWEDDRHHFRFIVSPEYGDQIDQHRDGLTGYVRELMAQMEHDLKTKLQWVAVNHYNTDDLHAHVLVRGKSVGSDEDLVIPRQYMSHGMRQAAQKIATQWLGERTQSQVHEALEKEVQAERFTSLDAIIEHSLNAAGQVQLRGKSGIRTNQEKRLYIAARLQHLQRMGLATKGRNERWTLDRDFKQTLFDLGQRNDIIKNLYTRLGNRSAYVVPFKPGPGTAPVVGRVLTIGLHDELRDQMYVLVQDEQGRMHYVRMANRETLAGLEEGGLVRVTGQNPSLTKTDARIAQVAQQNNGLYITEAHRKVLSKDFAKDDVESFLASHERRLQTLVNRGAAIRKGNGYHIQDVASLRRGDDTLTRSGSAFVEALSAKSIENQIDAEAITWLDRQLYLQSIDKTTSVEFDQPLQDAAQKRQQWMIEHGHAEMQDGQYRLLPGSFGKLRQAELGRVSQRLQERFGKPVHLLPNGGEAVGTYQGVESTHGGLFAIVNGQGQVSLAPVKHVPPLHEDSLVRATVSSQGRATIHRVTNQSHNLALSAGRG